MKLFTNKIENIGYSVNLNHACGEIIKIFSLEVEARAFIRNTEKMRSYKK